MTTQKRIIYTLISLAASLAIIFLAFYITLPPLSIQSVESWIFFTFCAAVIAFPIAFIFSYDSYTRSSRRNIKSIDIKFSKTAKVILAAVIGIPVAVVILGNIFSAVFFNAKSYAGIIEVEQAVFKDDMPESTTVSNIALMDTDSAIEFGKRELSSSQYEVSTNYTQINYKGLPKKVANLEYTGFFKWINNRDTGLPGYIMIDPVKTDADYILLDKPMKYVHSAYFGDDLYRKLRFDYPTKIFDSIYFEIDENDDPWFIVSCVKPKIGLFGAYDVSEVIIFNPCDGTSEIMSVSETPSWVDIVFNGDLACEKYNWQGIYHDGFWNSVISKIDCRQTTDDYGYITIGDDIWYFTGVTSLSNDASNIGFILSNARTGEYKFYPVVGAEEHSAMKSAEGEVSDKKYTASFPALVNISGEATYIMVLKDDSGIVKLYALVNVENYSIVVTGQTQKEAIEAYRKELVENGLISDDKVDDKDLIDETVTVKEVKLVTMGGETVVYVIGENGKAYKTKLSEHEAFILVKSGDVLKLKCRPSEVDGIFNIEKVETNASVE